MAASSGDDAATATCPAYPWPTDGAQRGRKVFMQSDCAACHTSLPFAGLSSKDAVAMEPKLAEIVVVEEAQPAVAVSGGACSPDITVIAKGLRGNFYAGGGAAAVCHELKKRALASPVWM